MENVRKNHRNKVYLPSQDHDEDSENCIYKYIDREFPEAKDGKSAVVYSVPGNFKKYGEKQASLAEQVVFTRLHGLKNQNLNQGLWVTFFHNASYGGQSFRNQRVGKLMIREHDFVIFAKCNDKYFVALAEVKSTYDGCKTIFNVDITSDAKTIKNNKRSAQHQLRDHIDILQTLLDLNPKDGIIKYYTIWPFLSGITQDPNRNKIKRWKDESNLHVFEEHISDQSKFDSWFRDNVISGSGISENHFIRMTKRYVILSCGVFVDEINDGMVALLTQEQLELITSDLCHQRGGGPMVVHGAAGTGKTLLALRKLKQLHELGELDANNRALYICYWPGIKCEIEQKLRTLNLDEYVDTARFYISQTGFLQRNNKKYKHIFMDESEAICLAFDAGITSKILSTIFQRYHDGNCLVHNCKEDTNQTYSFDNCASIMNPRDSNISNDKWGELWFLVDINQASMFLPKHSPEVLKTPTIVLNKVMRSTGYIFNIFKQYYSNPMPKLPESMLIGLNLSSLSMGHHILGPPVFWVNTEDEPNVQNALVRVIIDLCATKGFKPNDLCVIPFLVNDRFIPENINKAIGQYFVENGFRPNGVGDVEHFVSSKEVNDFLIAWALRVKGLEFKVVVMIIEDDDFDARDAEDRKKTYIMASRCTCLLILLSSKSVKDDIDSCHVMKEYPFNLDF